MIISFNLFSLLNNILFGNCKENLHIYKLAGAERGRITEFYLRTSLICSPHEGHKFNKPPTEGRGGLFEGLQYANSGQKNAV